MHLLCGRNLRLQKGRSMLDIPLYIILKYLRFWVYMPVHFGTVALLIYVSFALLTRYYYNKATKESKWTIPEELKVYMSLRNFIQTLLVLGFHSHLYGARLCSWRVRELKKQLVREHRWKQG